MADEGVSSQTSTLGERLLGSLAGFALPRFRKPNLAGAWSFSLTSPVQVFLLAGLSGVAGAGVLVTLTSALQSDQPVVLLGVVFVVLIVLYRWLLSTMMKSTSSAVEAALNVMRTRISAKLIRLDLRSFEQYPREELQAKMARHYDVISEATVGILGGLQSIFLLGLSLIYLATLSLVATAMSAAVLGLAIQAYFSRREELQRRMRSSADAETAMLGALSEIIDGFKELRLHAAKRAAVLDELSVYSTISASERTRIRAVFADLLVFSSTMAFLLGGCVVFLMPILLGETESGELARIVTVVLFIIGPLSSVVSAAQHFATAKFAVRSISDFEAQLDKIAGSQEEAAPAVLPPLQSLAVSGACFTHRKPGEDSHFRVGPISLAARAGEIVFVTGGNGSGKTTALRMITGLYAVEEGAILYNGVKLEGDPATVEGYRHLFGTVFADAHVFRKPTGLNDERLAMMQGLLERFQIASKLPHDLRAGINPDALSTGQRKRLAMAFALAEDRQIMVFDEWAADQDPQFREYFYAKLLPELKAAGKAVIAVTHDDRYFEMADRRYHMEEGHMSLVAGA